MTIRRSESPADDVYCRTRRRCLSLEKCLDDYLVANAFELRKRLCFRCPQGAAVRESYALGRFAPPPGPPAPRLALVRR